MIKKSEKIIAKAIDGYDHVTIYYDVRQINFGEYPLEEELRRASGAIEGCYRIYMVGRKTALLIGSKVMDFNGIGRALGRTSFNCNPMAGDPRSIVQKLTDLYGPDL